MDKTERRFRLPLGAKPRDEVVTSLANIASSIARSAFARLALRMSMYVRKIQMLFKSPEYQRQAYLRRKAVMKMKFILQSSRLI